MKKYTDFETAKEYQQYLIKNNAKIISAKKLETKQQNNMISVLEIKEPENKSINIKQENTDFIQRKLILNTTNVIDSHLDLHIKGLWKKTLNEIKLLSFNLNHSQDLEDVIADGEDLKAYTKNILWSELGYEFEGKTQALIFDAKILKERNSFAFKQYKNNWIRQHSVEMGYDKMFLCVNDKHEKEYYENYKKYIVKAINPEYIENIGAFYAVTEAKLFGGAAVTRGSNSYTPVYEPSNKTLEIKSTQNNEPDKLKQLYNYIKTK